MKGDSRQFLSNAKQPATGAAPHVNLDNGSTVFQFVGSGGRLALDVLLLWRR